MAIWLTILAVLWLLPTIVAVRRHVRHVGSIAVINIFLGWTFVGWVAALALATQTVESPQPRSTEAAERRRLNLTTRWRRTGSGQATSASAVAVAVASLTVRLWSRNSTSSAVILIVWRRTPSASTQLFGLSRP